MPELQLSIERSYRSQSDLVTIWLMNKTKHLLTGSLIFRGNMIGVAPIVPGASARVDIGGGTMVEQESTVTVALYSPKETDFRVREDLTLPTYTFGAFAVEVAKEGCKVTRGVRFMWLPGEGEVRPSLFVHEGSQLHRLTWGRIDHLKQGDTRECLVAGPIDRVEVVGTFSVNRVENRIGGGEDGLTLDLADQEGGVYHIARRLTWSDEELAEMEAEHRAVRTYAPAVAASVAASEESESAAPSPTRSAPARSAPARAAARAVEPPPEEKPAEDELDW